MDSAEEKGDSVKRRRERRRRRRKKKERKRKKMGGGGGGGGGEIERKYGMVVICHRCHFLCSGHVVFVS